jgi:cytochrome c553
VKISFGALLAFLSLSLLAVDAPRAAGAAPAWPWALGPAPPEGAAAPARGPGAPGARGGAAGRGAAGRGGGRGRGGDPTPQTLPGATTSFTRGQVGDAFNPADWFPEDHPPMPDVVAHGHAPEARACAFCHLPNGKGRPENAPLAGLPKDYIIEQLHDFRSGLRHGSEPRKEEFMLPVAKSLSEAEIDAVATYFSSMKPTPWIRVVETNDVPVTRIAGGMYQRVDDGGTEPIGQRIIEAPEDNAAASLRSPRSGFVAYVPAGSIKKGEAIVTTGDDGRTIPCSTCHGPDLRGIGPIPSLAGRSPSYIARQIYDIKAGTRNGAMAALMKPVVEKLTDEDIVNIVAYTASRQP